MSKEGLGGLGGDFQASGSCPPVSLGREQMESCVVAGNSRALEQAELGVNPVFL